MAGIKRKADEISELEEDDAGPVQIPPYDVAEETSARAIVTSDEYNKLKDGIRNICQRITEPLKKSEFKDASAVRVVELTEARLLDNGSEEIMVTVTGNMGSGKSSTINSIFSCGMIARSDKSGSSVTLVPHIYCGPVTDQSHKFIIEIQFFNREERERFFEAEIAAFYRAGSQTDELEEEGFGRGGAGDDIDTRDTVADALHSVFLEHRECQTKRLTREFLKSATSENDKVILAQLNKWADKLVFRQTEGQDSVWLKASTPQEMLKQVEMYSTEITDEESQRVLSMWPLVRLIKVHFNNPLSKMGVSVLDAPGSSDNHIRRETALELKRKCSHAAIVVGAARANNEGIVSKEVNAAKAKGQGRVIVIVTGSDEIDPNTLIGGNSADRQYVADLQALVDRLQNESNALMLQIGTVKDHMQRADLYGQKMLLDVRLHKAQNKERAARIAMRSMNTAAKLQEKLMDITESQVPIPVISVSNVDYAKHLLGHNTGQAPTLSVEETQIPTVRRLFAEFPNDARRSEIEHLFKNVLPSAIRRVELFCTTNNSDRKAEVVAYVERAKGRYQPFVEKAFHRMEEHFDHDISAHVRSAEQHWSEDADELCDEWKLKFKTSPFLGLMNGNGMKRTTKKSGAVNLSGELIHLAGGSIGGRFSVAKNPLIENIREILNDANYLLKDMRQSIEQDPSASIMDLKPFFDYVDSEGPNLRGAVSNHAKEFLGSLELIKAKLTTEVEDAYLVAEMLPVYAEVRKIKGGKDKIMDKPKIGWGAHRHLTFKGKVTAFNGVWLKSCVALEQDFKQLLEVTKGKMSEAIGEVFDRLVSSFGNDNDSTGIDESAQKELRKLLKVSLEEADEYVKTELDPAYEALPKNNTSQADEF